MKFAFGDIYLVDFEPSVGHEYKNKRPAIVIQQEWGSEKNPCITIMPISSKIEKRAEHDIFVIKDSKNRLMSDSVIKTRHICTFDKSRFIFHIGKAGSPTIRQVRGFLRRHFGL